MKIARATSRSQSFWERVSRVDCGLVAPEKARPRVTFVLAGVSVDLLLSILRSHDSFVGHTEAAYGRAQGGNRPENVQWPAGSGEAERRIGMRVAVLSDTHTSSIEQLPARLLDDLRAVDLIVHLGDYTGTGLLDGLRSLGEFRGVRGNMDPPSFKGMVPDTEVLEIGGKRLGLIHGWGAPWGLQKRVRGRFKGVDAILYGHTHLAASDTIDGTLFFNPGSASGKFPAMRKTYGILTIEESLDWRVVTVD